MPTLYVLRSSKKKSHEGSLVHQLLQIFRNDYSVMCWESQSSTCTKIRPTHILSASESICLLEDKQKTLESKTINFEKSIII